MIQIYCGDGKGKTTAALGLAVRAAGSGMHVRFVQFLKGGHTSELNILSGIPEISVMRCQKNYGFTFRMNDLEKTEITNDHNRMLREILSQIYAGSIQMLILDEFFSAYHSHLLDKELANRLVFTCPDQIELVLTGRNPEQKFMDIADYISEIKAVKHPYQKGISARLGIEY
ncbi:MAG: cob(I)yrinic acid a,c-diamide adenosyltransferase [Oscillospiraceae bacterium]|nr:cob(I)yrinic acid a,c-diamide adenosyltransferase [Oscillospiraceae bacterium]MDE5885896.1 cob(I)yrinic acid a,c-diamide adenosyltransferase [Oscillospiraceae bacterium]